MSFTGYHLFLQIIFFLNDQAQLGREGGLALFGQAAGSTTGNVGEESSSFNEGATVRVQMHNQVDRRGINKWWKEQMRTCESQHLFSVLLGEEGGALTCRVNPPNHVNVHDGQLV